MMNRAFVLAVGLTASCFALPSYAQNVASQTRVEMDAPSGEMISVANPIAGNPSTTPVVALVTVAVDSNDRYQYRAVASDPTNGAVLWSRNLGAACATRLDDYSLVVPLANGDVVVSALALDPVAPAISCVMRLRATDGEVLWSHTFSGSGTSLDIYSLIEDSQGHLLAAGRKGSNALIAKLDGQTGQTLWDHEVAADSGATLRGFAIVADANNVVVDLLAKASNGSSSLRLVAVDSNNGSERWNLGHCAGGQFVAYQRSGNDVRLRMLADSTVEYVASCLVGSIPSVELGRLQVATGVPVWQRTLTASNLYRAVIGVEGNLLLEGTLDVDGAEVGVARLDTNDAHLQWSMPRPAVPPPMAPYTSNRYVIAGSYLHVLELNVIFSDYVDTATVATYALDSGQFLGRIDAGFPVGNLVVPRTASIAAFGSGEVLVTALSGRNRYVGSRLFETRLNALGGQLGWSRQTSVMAPFPFKPTAERQNQHLMGWNAKGTPGLLLGGYATNGNNYDYPRAAKIDARDGRVLWRWELDKGIRGNVAAIFSDQEGNAIVAGSNGRDNPPLLLSKLDGANGQALWEASDSVSRVALDGTLDAAGNVLLLLESNGSDTGARLRAGKRSAADGASRWETVIPESGYASPDERRVVSSSDGSVLVLGSWQTDGSTSGMQVTRLGNANGAIEWRRKLPGLIEILPTTMQVLASGDVIVATEESAWRIDAATGNVEWQKLLPFHALTMVVDHQGGFVIGGFVSGAIYADRRALARFNAATGIATWSRQLPLLISASYSERVSAVEIAADGNILAASGDDRNGQGLAKIAFSNGATLWEAVTSNRNLSAGSAFPITLLPSPDGNIYLGGLLGEMSSWTVTRITGSFADGIFATGFE